MARKDALGCVRPCAAEGFFWAGEGEVAGGEIRGILQFEPIKSRVCAVSGAERGWEGGKHEKFRIRGLAMEITYPIDGECIV